ncbi:hypothetical protein [Streptomyces sp. 7N604]|uniref:hypothetical protein n=1 Tax=Streptomyces sp. 7N604 TaxID=3457415 RepID=UPI003FD25643
MRTGMLVGGEWTAGNGTTFTTVTLATGEVLAELPAPSRTSTPPYGRRPGIHL